MNNNYYVMLASAPINDGAVIEDIEGPDFDSDDGVKLETGDDVFSFELSVDDELMGASKYTPLDVYEAEDCLLFSRKLIELLDSLNVSNIQYFNSVVHFLPTGEALEYKVANIVGVISALNIDESTVYLSSIGEVINIEKMCLVDNIVKGVDIFRLKESVMHIIVHKPIKEAIEQAGITGFMFVSDEDFSSEMI